ncbi:MAG: pyridoxal phosphate-dependent aminotransferase [Alphaproteobacteria bacterium]
MAKRGAIRACYRDAPKRGFPPTAAAVQAKYELENIRALSLNECPMPPSPAVIAAVKDAVSSANRYPDALCRELGAALAASLEVAASRIVFGNGSDEMLGLIGAATLEMGDEAVMPTPSFPGYAHATYVAGGQAVAVALRADGANDVEALLAAITPKTRLLFCSTVNNPSGGMLEAAGLLQLIEGTPDDVFLVMDDAYGAFVQHAGGPDVLPLMAARRAPWAVLRTFSKTHGLAGLRVGYGIFDSDEVVASILQVKGTFNVNILAQVAALAALADAPYKDLILSRNGEQRQRLAEGAAALGLTAMPGVGNFISLRLPISGLAAAGAMLEKGIMVRPWVEAGYENCLRITIGDAADTDAVLAALKAVVGAK